jgi:hypothetical protein
MAELNYRSWYSPPISYERVAARLRRERDELAAQLRQKERELAEYERR